MENLSNTVFTFFRIAVCIKEDELRFKRKDFGKYYFVMALMGEEKDEGKPYCFSWKIFL